jgi:hypothetical protein
MLQKTGILTFKQHLNCCIGVDKYSDHCSKWGTPPPQEAQRQTTSSASNPVFKIPNPYKWLEDATSPYKEYSSVPKTPNLKLSSKIQI